MGSDTKLIYAPILDLLKVLRKTNVVYTNYINCPIMLEDIDIRAVTQLVS